MHAITPIDYSIISINGSGYDRFIKVTFLGGEPVVVHLHEFDEYLEPGEQIQKRRPGDFMQGILSVDLVRINYKTDEELRFNQPIEMSSYSQMVVKVIHRIDEYSLYASTNFQNIPLLIEFESQIHYKEGDVLYLEGSLEFLDASDLSDILEE